MSSRDTVYHLANRDIELAGIRDFYLSRTPSQRANIRRFANAVASLIPNGLEERGEFWDAMGTGESVSFDLSFLLEHENGPGCAISPRELASAIARWEG